MFKAVTFAFLTAITIFLVIIVVQLIPPESEKDIVCHFVKFGFYPLSHANNVASLNKSELWIRSDHEIKILCNIENDANIHHINRILLSDPRVVNHKRQKRSDVNSNIEFKEVVIDRRANAKGKNKVCCKNNKQTIELPTSTIGQSIIGQPNTTVLPNTFDQYITEVAQNSTKFLEILQSTILPTVNNSTICCITDMVPIPEILGENIGGGTKIKKILKLLSQAAINKSNLLRLLQKIIQLLKYSGSDENVGKNQIKQRKLETFEKLISKIKSIVKINNYKNQFLDNDLAYLLKVLSKKGYNVWNNNNKEKDLVNLLKVTSTKESIVPNKNKKNRIPQKHLSILIKLISWIRSIVLNNNKKNQILEKDLANLLKVISKKRFVVPNNINKNLMLEKDLENLLKALSKKESINSNKNNKNQALKKNLAILLKFISKIRLTVLNNNKKNQILQKALAILIKIISNIGSITPKKIIENLVLKNRSPNANIQKLLSCLIWNNINLNPSLNSLQNRKIETILNSLIGRINYKRPNQSNDKDLTELLELIRLLQTRTQAIGPKRKTIPIWSWIKSLISNLQNTSAIDNLAASLQELNNIFNLNGLRGSSYLISKRIHRLLWKIRKHFLSLSKVNPLSAIINEVLKFDVKITVVKGSKCVDIQLTLNEQSLEQISNILGLDNNYPKCIIKKSLVVKLRICQEKKCGL